MPDGVAVAASIVTSLPMRMNPAATGSHRHGNQLNRKRCVQIKYAQLSLASFQGCQIEYQLQLAGVKAGVSPLLGGR